MSLFDFTRNEIRGGFFLIIILVCAVGLKLIIEFNYNQTVIQLNYSEKEFVKSTPTSPMEFSEKKVNKIDVVVPERKKLSTIKTIQPIEIFNPNNYTAKQWQKIGLSSKLSLRIVKFIANGKGIKRKEDLKKIYGLDDAIYLSIKDSVLIPVLKVEVNGASKIDFEKLNGIGGVLAARIIKYRNLLGGFTSYNQLESTYGLDSNWLPNNLEYLELDKSKIKKIKINNSSKKTLATHPYINDKEAKEIILKRSRRSLDSNSVKHLLGKEKFSLIRLYLDYE